MELHFPTKTKNEKNENFFDAVRNFQIELQTFTGDAKKISDTLVGISGFTPLGLVTSNEQ
jgi:hypothetical protein